MADLIKIEARYGMDTVNGRNLHIFLDSRDRFDQWIKRRIEKYGFIKDQDFCTELCKTSGRPYTEYYLSIDMAKELSMVENNSKGREARQYFIAVEKRAKEVLTGPALMAAALIEAQKTLDNHIKKIEEMKPKAEFYDQVTGSKDSIDIGTAAKVLNIKGIGRNTLFDKLREKKILMENNQPYQSFIDRGYFRTIQQKYTKPDGSTHINIKTVVFQKGLDFIRKQVEV